MKSNNECHILLSILIPNLGYSTNIFRCLDSLLACSADKTLYEIVFFDQSDETISSRLKCEIEQRYGGFIVFLHGDIKSLYFARHTLMSFANGEYCSFVDSDDYVDHNYIDSILKNIFFYNFPDLLIYNFFIDDINGKTILRNEKIVETEIQHPLESFVYLSSINSAWRKVFKKTLYDYKAYESFNEIKIGEDKVFSYPIMLASKKIIVLRDNYYHYVLSSNSMMARANLMDYIKYLELPIHSIGKKMNNREKRMFCHFLCAFFLDLYEAALSNESDFILLTNAVKKEIDAKRIRINDGSTFKEKALIALLKGKNKVLFKLCKRKKRWKKKRL